MIVHTSFPVILFCFHVSFSKQSPRDDRPIDEFIGDRYHTFSLDLILRATTSFMTIRKNHDHPIAIVDLVLVSIVVNLAFPNGN